MATESRLYNTTSTVHNGYYCRLHESLKLLNIRPALHILMQKAVMRITCRTVRKFLAEESVRSEVFGQRDAYSFESQLNCCVVMNEDLIILYIIKSLSLYFY